MLAIEANDEWLVTCSYMSRPSTEPLLEARLDQTTDEEVRASSKRPE